jgi:hypothetical protein
MVVVIFFWKELIQVLFMLHLLEKMWKFRTVAIFVIVDL